ncbi:MAG TPA: hypothetical protein VF771_13875 [Longimicrobiaceae bacterium]
MRTTRLLLAIAVTVLSSAPAAGQALQPGTRVRVAAPIIRHDSRFTGTVVSTENGRVLLQLDRTVRQDTQLDTISIPLNLIRRVEVSLGQGSGDLRGPAAITGGVAGLVVGVLAGLLVGSGEDEDGATKNPWPTALLMGPLVGAAGAGVGALIGDRPHEQWQTMRLPRPAAGPTAGRGLYLGVSLGV